MKISREKSDFLKIKNKKIHAARKMDAGADDKLGYFFTKLDNLNAIIGK